MTAISPVRNNYVAVAATSTTTFGAAGAYIHSVVVNVASRKLAMYVEPRQSVREVGLATHLGANVPTSIGRFHLLPRLYISPIASSPEKHPAFCVIEK